MNAFKNYQYIAYFYHSNPHQYMSLTEILNHAIEHNTLNIAYTLITIASSSSCMT